MIRDGRAKPGGPWRTGLMALLAVLGAGPIQPASAVTASGPIARLAWLAGCWARDDGDRHSEEQWTAPRGGTMLGVSRTIVGDRTVAWEQLRIEEEDGVLVLTAVPSDQQETRFRQIALGEDSVTFENPDHDFPQRILYRLQQDGSLLGRIEGTRDGEVRAVDFPMQRVRCP
jgi:hypothetical protein